MKFIDTPQTTPFECQVLNVLHNNALPDLLMFSEFKIPILELYLRSKLNENDDKNNYIETYVAELSEALTALMNTKANINYIDENSNEEVSTITPLLSSFLIENDMCIYSFNEFIKKLLCRSDVYLKLNPNNK